MNCVVTAGPTHEPLDSVRRLTNLSTGKLGSQFADYLADQGHNVVLLKGHYSIFQAPSKARDQTEFSTATDLENHLQSLTRQRVDAVFHAAAVSDFKFGKIWRRLASGQLREVENRKLSSRDSALLAELVPTPKLIGKLREWFPNAWLVGWKYEVDGDRARAMARAKDQILETQTDACVVNGPAYGEGFGYLTEAGKYLHLEGSAALFACLEQNLRR